MKTPLHIVLRQYRVLQIFLVLFLCYVTYVLLMWVTAGTFAALSPVQAGVIATTFPALITGLFAIVNNINKKNEVDDHDKDK